MAWKAICLSLWCNQKPPSSASRFHNIIYDLRDQILISIVFTIILLIGWLALVGVGVRNFVNPYHTSPSEQFVWMGALKSNEISFRVKLEDSSTSFRIAITTNEDLSGPSIFSRYYDGKNDAFDDSGVVAITVTNLTANIQYYYFVQEQSGEMVKDLHGAFRTPLPIDSHFDFTFAVASCAWTGSTSKIFTRLEEDNPLFFLQMGDLFYGNINKNDPKKYRKDYKKVFGSKNQASLFRNVPIVYMWDDHDFGPNDSDSEIPSKESALEAYAEFVPHYPFPNDITVDSKGIPDAVFQSFQIGRIGFIITDLRSQRDPATNKDNAEKTMMGSKQKQWFKNQLLALANSSAIFWVSSVPWIYEKSGKTDSWGGYTVERNEIANFIKTNGLVDKLYTICGDAHMLAFDDGTHNLYWDNANPDSETGWPVFQSAPLDQYPSKKGGPYSHGCSAKNHQYGLISVSNTAVDACVEFQGRNMDGTFFKYNTCKPSNDGNSCRPPPIDGAEGFIALCLIVTFVIIGVGLVVNVSWTVYTKYIRRKYFAGKEAGTTE